jgi:hypothetical protein
MSQLFNGVMYGLGLGCNMLSIYMVVIPTYGARSLLLLPMTGLVLGGFGLGRLYYHKESRIL